MFISKILNNVIKFNKKLIDIMLQNDKVNIK